MSRIAITGSSGLIGTALGGRLASAGHDVVGVRRGDASDPSAMWDPAGGWFREGSLDGMDAVVHLAGVNIGEKRWSEGRKQAIVDSRIKGTRLLVDHLASLERKPAVLVSASAVGFYGSRGDVILTEEASRGEGFLAALVAAWEAEALRAADVGIRTVVMRNGVVLSKDGGALAKMLLPFKLGAGGRIGGGKMWFSWISLEDVAAAYEFVIGSGLSGPVNAVAPNPVINADYTMALGRALHRPTVVPIPPAGLKLLYGGELVDEMLLASQRVMPAVLADAGFTFAHPRIETALESALAA